MRALFHTLGAVIVVPYVALALLFLFIGQLAQARNLLEMINIIWDHIDLVLGWWIYIAPVLWAGLIATAFVPQWQRAGSLCLCLVAVASVGIVITLSSEPVGLGELIFLLPCLAVAASSAFLGFLGPGQPRNVANQAPVPE